MRLLIVLLVTCSLLIGVPATLFSANTTGMLGALRQEVEARLGAPVAIYHLKADGPPAVYAYCLGGMYRPYYYDHLGHWVEGTREEPLRAYTYGRCTSDQRHPVTILGRFEADRLAVVGYIGPHGNIAYDLGWQRYVDRVVSGIVPADNGEAVTKTEFDSAEVTATRRYQNGVTVIGLTNLGVISDTATLYYKPNTRIDRHDPLVGVLAALSVQYHK